MFLQNQVRNHNFTTSISNSNTSSLIEPFDDYSEYWGKDVTCYFIDKLVLVKTGRVSNPFLLDVSSKLEQTFSNGVLQRLSALHFIPEIVIFSQTGVLCQNIFLCLFFLSVVQESKFWVCQLSNALLSMANEPLQRPPMPPKSFLLQNCNQPPKSSFSALLLIF